MGSDVDYFEIFVDKCDFRKKSILKKIIVDFLLELFVFSVIIEIVFILDILLNQFGIFYCSEIKRCE